MKEKPKNSNFTSKKNIDFGFEKLIRYFSFLLLLSFILSATSFGTTPIEFEIENETEVFKFEEIVSKISKKSSNIYVENDFFKSIFQFYNLKIRHINVIFELENKVFNESFHLIEIPIPPPEYI